MCAMEIEVDELTTLLRLMAPEPTLAKTLGQLVRDVAELKVDVQHLAIEDRGHDERDLALLNRIQSAESRLRQLEPPAGINSDLCRHETRLSKVEDTLRRMRANGDGTSA